MTERKIRIYGPLILFLFLLVFFYAMLITTSSVAVKWTTIPLFYAVLIWEMGRLLIFFCRKKVPGIRHVGRRIVLLITVGIPLSALMALVEQSYTIWTGLYKSFDLNDYFFLTGLNILCGTIVTGVYESHYYIQQWKLLFIESERMKKKNWSSQYQFLKDQIKPHFLFNSLNTLTALITTDPTKAERFIEEMSSVYRYLLTENTRNLTTLKEELTFLDSYLLMLRTRFEDTLVVRLNINPRFEDYLLPPFVLQILIENAVKHNVISTDNPLLISLHTDLSGNLHVSNNLQRKPNPDFSEKKGLANIISRYKLLDKENALRITEEGGLFKVVIPLLKTTHLFASQHPS
jgi:hypothetical protein